MVDGIWTLGELAERAAYALAGADVRAPNGRVTEVPDARVIRWYTTTGLLDRPVVRGRVARYGPRHLLQLVAVKRLQAQGLPLAQVQARLAGATDDVLARVAALPPDLLTEAGAIDAAKAPRSWGSAAPQRAADPQDLDDRFWARRPVDETPAGVDNGDDTVSRVYAVDLRGVTLLLPAEPAPHDLPAIAAAARPLLDLLAERGWLGRGGGQVLPHALLNPTEGAAT